ncbi:hypothetical protein HCB27_14280 [Listeria booriae]|uniref:Uncharacterized protein n=1 Tax=Listeria booriae TaxID=1552123 RepID=A0A7X0Z8A2_9LIST|nr:hypothetical protein [Listeria booriae]MBC1914241.1 hypothetical protein [Listeria booriae]MBC2177783.1 hypothetical protein [Listeria booriae]MBC2177796.1 hypothetical protein [Listeria booriae]
MDKEDELRFNIRKKESEMDMYQSQVKHLEIKLDKLYYAKEKQIGVLNNFLETQYKRKQKYKEVLAISGNIKFMKSHSTRVLDILHGARANQTEMMLEASRTGIDVEITQTQEEIERLRAMNRLLDSEMQQLYFDLRKLSM